MLVSDTIFNSLTNAKIYSKVLLERIVNKKIYGENLAIDQQNFMILSQWIKILQSYYDKLDEGNIPEDSCFTYDEISTLMSKIKVMIGTTKLTAFDDWIFSTGYYNDNGFWRDSEVWNDEVIFS